ncbi:MAG: family 43 glycosylhydrolase [Planctomycetota bacterium]|nr:family 43 glycosylhydrolase [Planctomycetota bacterium]
MATIRNPVLRGFHPDPALCTVGDDCYLATSTCEWFPGIALHHSRDLVHWRPCGSAFSARFQVDLRGVPDSGGLWAPDLSWCEGRFWLTTALVRTRHWPMMDAVCLVSTAPTIAGPWSEPVPLAWWGWDPALFHDEDGRSWFLSMLLDPRPGRDHMAGVVLAPFDRARCALAGEPQLIYRGSGAGAVEGPRLYRHQGWYYLVVAEGGTKWQHRATVARSRRIEGPYETDPAGPLVTSRGHPAHPLQKAGHASLARLSDGSWWLACLCARPLADGSCVFGRETALAPIAWVEGWPRLATGGVLLPPRVPAPNLPPAPWHGPLDDALPGILPAGFLSLRDAPDPQWYAWDGAVLALRGRDPPTSCHEQSVIARRLSELPTRCSLRLDYQPTSPDEMAGLLVRYDSNEQLALLVSGDGAGGRCLRLTRLDAGQWSEPEFAPAPAAGLLRLAVEVAAEGISWSWAAGDGPWQAIGGRFPLAPYGDDYREQWRFTGAVIGCAAYDRHRRQRWARFGELRWEEADQGA